MLLVHCHHCGTRQLVGTRSILSLRNTGEGRIAHVRCHSGHVVVITYDNDGRATFAPADAPVAEVDAGALAATA